ncbi:MAG: hypothetical protein EPO12_19835 [Aquabacterium sp.]|jgi:hypothetical protein|nr:MAG: hypothetical protein EPO12_19835 [Aquabacterium sp.]
MAKCAYCSTTILFGGKRNGDLRFCNDKCLQGGSLAIAATQLPASEVAVYVGKVHRGSCPSCAGPGPVDVHTSYRVWSALVMTQWSSRPLVGCKSCGTKRKLGDAAFSLVLGWWGFPWGLVMTPVQLGRNLFALARTPDPTTPSPALEKILRLHLAAQAVEGRGRLPAAPGAVFK